jgi:hypothetical protein
MAQELVLSLAGLLTAITVIIGALVAIYRLARKIEGAIGVDKNGRTISERLDRVEHQLWENGGASLADRVNRIETHTTVTSAKTDVIEKILTSQWWATSSHEEPQPAVATTRKTRQKKIS